MARVSLQSDNSNGSSDELPFLKEWAKALRHDYEFDKQDYPVGRVYVSEKGLLLLTAEFKCFLFANSKLSKQLTEALEAWTSGTEPLGYLYIVPLNRRGSIDIGLETNIKPKIWEKSTMTNIYGEERILYEQKFESQTMKDAGFKPVKCIENPFLTANQSSPPIGYNEIGAPPTSEKSRRRGV